ncbi:hypothetical protein LSH36_680g00013 [Paralvinella palmiformis]|uniref:Ubiquitin-like protease family profile domain-containing protein n=1 Tax=Paralvinella palmiformis TaxID=53620 RepID=A0AAD9J2H1_9ANNE|nr:hypothetical protein LSH36_680g00013 [Paralvinella palmiformis]
MGNAAAIKNNKPASSSESTIQVDKGETGSEAAFDKESDLSDAEVSGGSCASHVTRRKRITKTSRHRASRDRKAVDPDGYSQLLPHRLPAMIQEIQEDEELSDEHIDHAQALLRKEFAEISGFLSNCVLAAIQSSELKSPRRKFVQIFHLPERHHWICASNLLSDDQDQLVIYDSAIRKTSRASLELQEKLAAMLNRRHDVSILWADVKRQNNSVDCGVHAIAAAVALCHGIDPSTCDWQYERMRSHLSCCFEAGEIRPFPVRECGRQPGSPARSMIRIHCPCGLPVREDDDKTWRCSSCLELFHQKCVIKLIEINEPFCCDLCAQRT